MCRGAREVALHEARARLTRRLPWELFRTLLRAVVIDARHGVVPWRWLVALVAFAVAALIGADILHFSFRQNRIDRLADVWDLFPAMLINQVFLPWLLALGFMLLVGDSYLRAREQGTVAPCVLRLPSRTIWWLGKMGALGVLSLCFVGLGLAVTLLVGCFIAPPGAVPLLGREGLPGMYPRADLFVPTYILLLAGYTAWALWIVGSCIVLLSVFIPRHATVLAASLLWVATSLPWLRPHYRGPARLLSLDYFISASKHELADPMSWRAYFAISAAAAVLIAVAGSWRLRWEEL